MTFDVNGKIEYINDLLIIPVKRSTQANEIVSLNECGKPILCDIDIERKKKSRNANGYAWALMGQIAEKISVPNAPITKWDVYVKTIKEYSNAYTHVVIPEQAIPQFAATCKDSHMYVENVGEVTVNGKKGIQLRVYYGSSTFDEKQMSRLIDGIVADAKELGIETATPEELSRLKDEWGK